MIAYDDIPGQQPAKMKLLRMISESRVPHALLFSGNDGCGHLPAAAVFARHLLCSDPKPEGPCNACSACLRAGKLEHPDLHLVFPIAKSKTVRVSDDLVKSFRELFIREPFITLRDWFNEVDAENKQPIIPVEESSDILRKLSYTSFEGAYKVMIIWQPEKMNTEAANRLLKILEEPPEKTVFILVSSAPDQLLATITSRVQQVGFYSCSDDAIAAMLKKQYGIDDRAARQAALLADGNYREAQELMKEGSEDVSFLTQFRAFMLIAVKFDGIRALQWVDDFGSAGREKHKQFLQYALGIFRDCIMYNFGDRSLVRIDGPERTFLEKFAPYVHAGNYERLVEEFNKNFYYVERNAHAKILFTELLLTTNALLAIRPA